MRKRKEIENDIKRLSEGRVYSEFTNLALRYTIQIELLLDIRELLIALACHKALIAEDFKGEYSVHPPIIVADCNVIPDRAKLVKMKEKLDKLLKKP